jgi:hypothetical protein
MAMKYNLTAIVVFITFVEGLAVCINMVQHPELQPALTAGIVIVATVANGLVVWYLPKNRKDILWRWLGELPAANDLTGPFFIMFLDRRHRPKNLML